MCDTDSVITDAKLNDYPDLMEEFMRDGCGDALGSLKMKPTTTSRIVGGLRTTYRGLKKRRAGCSILMRSSWVGVSSIASGKRGVMILQN